MNTKLILVAIVLVTMVTAAPIDDRETSVLRFESDNIGVGPYNWE